MVALFPQILATVYNKMRAIFNGEPFEVPLHPVTTTSGWMLTLHGGISEWSIAGNYKVSIRLWRRETKHRSKDDDENEEKARPEWGKAYEASRKSPPSPPPPPVPLIFF